MKTVGSALSTATERPADRATVAQFYAALSPTFLFHMAARQIAAARGDSLSENARNLALISIATNDSLIASFKTKYHYNFWRPYTAIRSRHGWQRQDGRRPGVDDVHRDALLPELSVEPRERQQRGGRDAAADLRCGRPRDHAVGHDPGHRPDHVAVHLAEADHRRHRRRPGVRRHPLPLRSGCRRSGSGGRSRPTSTRTTCDRFIPELIGPRAFA